MSERPSNVTISTFILNKIQNIKQQYAYKYWTLQRYIYIFCILNCRMRSAQPEVPEEVKMLREYCQTLERENNSRNEERMVLEKEVERLNNIINKSDTTRKMVITPCEECKKLKSEIIKLQNSIERLQKQNNNLQESNNVLSTNLAQRTRAEKVEVKPIEASNITLGAGSSIASEKTQELLGKLLEAERKNGEQSVRYSELSHRFDKLSVENSSLKNKMENLEKSLSSSSNMEQQVGLLTSEKYGLSLQVSGLEQEMHKIKLLLSQKEQDMFSLKNKQTLIISAHDVETKALKETLVSRDKQIGLLRQKTNHVGALQQQNRTLKSQFQNKTSQIHKLKQQVARGSEQAKKIQRVELELNTTKSILSQREIRIQQLVSKLSESETLWQRNQSSLESGLHSLNVQLSQKTQLLENLQLQVPSLQTQIQSLQGQVQSYKSRIIDMESKPSQTLQINSLKENISHYTGQITDLNLEIGKLRTDIRDKEVYIKRIQDEIADLQRRDENKNEEVRRLDSVVIGYVEKIGKLEVELNRIESIKNSRQPLNTTFSPSPQLQSVTKQNQTLNMKIQYLENRIKILQQTNHNLREQLRKSIELRNRERETTKNTIISGESEQLLGTIKILKTDVDDLRILNNKMKMENQYLQSKLSSAEVEIQGLLGIPRGIQIGRKRDSVKADRDLGIVATNKALASMPVETTNLYTQAPLSKSISSPFKSRELTAAPQQIFSSTSPHVYRSPLPPNSSSYPSSYPYPYSYSQQALMISSKSPQKKHSNNQFLNPNPNVQISNISASSNEGKKIMMMTSSQHSSTNMGMSMTARNAGNAGSGDYGALQRKIQMLKEENKGLRRHLYDGQ